MFKSSKVIPYWDIIVTIEHPQGTFRMPLEDWIEHGPGGRPYIHPHAAHRQSTGEALPLSVIPFRYRNNLLCILLMKVGLMQNPWKPK